MGRRSSSTELTTQSILEYVERGTLCVGIFSGGLALFQSSILQLAVPTLSLSLVLGYFNRRQMDQALLAHVITLKSDVQKLDKAASRHIPQPRLNLGVIEQQISDLHSQDGALHQAIADLNQQLQAIPTQSSLDDLYQSLAQLTQMVHKLQNTDLTATESSTESSVDHELAKVQAAHQILEAQLQMQLDQMHHEISVLRTQPIPASMNDLATLTPAEILPALSPGSAEIASPLIAMTQSPESWDLAHPTVDLTPLSTELTWVKGQVNTLQLQLQQLIQQSQQIEVAIPGWDQVVEDVQNLTHRVDAWEKNSDQRWSSVKQGLSTMPEIIQSQLNQQLQILGQTSVKPEEFYVLQRHVQQQTDALKAKVEQAVLRFSQDIDSLTSQIQELIHPPTNGNGHYQANPLSLPERLSRQSVPLALDPLTYAKPSETQISVTPVRPPIATPGPQRLTEEIPDWDSLLAELDQGSR